MSLAPPKVPNEITWSLYALSLNNCFSTTYASKAPEILDLKRLDERGLNRIIPLPNSKHLRHSPPKNSPYLDHISR